MKIFISHASANKEYGNALVDLLRTIGVKEGEIIFTSNTAYGIPIGQNIFNWLKSQISDKPFVIYLLSKEYYASIACLNEMGAAWIIENEHAMLFIPNFEIGSKEFQNGAIDPREIGFFINDEERVLSFIQQLESYFDISKNSVLIHQNVKKYIATIKSIVVGQSPLINTENKISNNFVNIALQSKTEDVSHNRVVIDPAPQKISSPDNHIIRSGIFQKFTNEIVSGKLKDEELILLHYVIETSRIKLFTGWQEQQEISKIQDWEEINDLNSTLSSNYDKAIRKLELRGYTNVSAITASGNPKEVMLKSDIGSNILDLPQNVLDTIKKAVENNKGYEKVSADFDLPF